MRLTASNQNAQREREGSGDANSFPWLGMDEFIGCMRSGLGFLGRQCLKITQCQFRFLETLFKAGAQFRDALAGLACRRTQQFLRIGDDQFEVSDQLVFSNSRVRHKIPFRVCNQKKLIAHWYAETTLKQCCAQSQPSYSVKV